MFLAQIFAVVIFLIMFVLIVIDKIPRHIIALVAGACTVVLVFGIAMQSWDAFWTTLNVEKIFTVEFWYAGAGGESASEGINWETIIFIAGMMVMVEGMARVGFFRWLCMELAKIVKYKPVPLLITFMIMSACLAMFIDSITVILFLAAVTIELARLLKFDPVPMILAEVFCANLGGSATMCGDPPNIIIGTSLGYSFFDFLVNTGLMAGVGLVLTVILFWLMFHKELESQTNDMAQFMHLPQPREAITNKREFTISTVIFLLAVVLLVTHAQTGLTVGVIGVFIAAITLLAAPKHVGEILKKVDYKTLLFFIGLFVVVGGLEQTGILEIIAEFIGEVSHGNLYLMIGIVIWVSAIASAFVDNIPFTATMIPVIKSLAEVQGVDLSVLAWSLTMGADIGGSATPIGASANVVGTSVAANAGHEISWGRYCKASVPAMVLVVMSSMLIIFFRYL